MSRYSCQTRNPRAVHNPLRSIPLFRPASAVFRSTPTDHLIGDIRVALYARRGYVAAYAAACAKLGKANRSLRQYRRANQRYAMCALNTARAAMRANARLIATTEAQLLALAVPADRWAQALSYSV